MELTRSEILANRRKWIDFLKNRKLRKAVESLDNGNGARCCLGHGCYVLGIKREKHKNEYYQNFVYGSDREDAFAPKEFVEAVGLWDSSGIASGKPFEIDGFKFTDLTEANDHTSNWKHGDYVDINIRPWQIGEYLETVIQGGYGTPFRPLNEYPK